MDVANRKIRVTRPKKAGDNHRRSPPGRALEWVRAHELRSGGILVHSHHGQAYQEVTGYLIPTLRDYGERELATRLVGWLLAVQTADGASTDPYQGEPYVFDSGQVLRGLLASVISVPAAREAARRAADWLCAQMVDGGRGGFGPRYAGSIPESVHLYVLPPLYEAGKLLREQAYQTASDRCLEYYVKHPDALRLSSFTHFLGYELEALIDLGHVDLAVPVLEALRRVQSEDGSVRGAGDVQWVCAPGLAQVAICWYKTGQWEPADKALAWLDAHQRPSGGFLGSYGPGASYFPHDELSWAAKFYLDANVLRVLAFFERHADSFPSHVAMDDGRTQAILSVVKPGDQVLEVGCGKGRFLKAVRQALPETECVGVDISPALLRHLPKGVRGLRGSLEVIPCPDDSFDVVFSVEAIEHSSNREASVAEMTRVARPGGWVVIIDKQQAHWGRLSCPPWETWPENLEMSRLLSRSCDDVTSNPVGYDDRPAADDLMVVWRGRKRSRRAGALDSARATSPAAAGFIVPGRRPEVTSSAAGRAEVNAADASLLPAGRPRCAVRGDVTTDRPE
jgi:malonyl-CoA O-methyltransferase